MANFEELYSKELTDLSLVELKKFLTWCMAKLKRLPVIVGG